MVLREELTQEEQARREEHRPLNFYLKAAVVTAERLESGRWRLHGRGWLEGVEISDEDLRANFTQI